MEASLSAQVVADSGERRRAPSPARRPLQGSIIEEVRLPAALGDMHSNAAAGAQRARSISPGRRAVDAQQQQQWQQQQMQQPQQSQQSQQSQQQRHPQQPQPTQLTPQLAGKRSQSQVVGLMAKLEGIASTVHEVLGTLDMKQSSAATKLRSAMMPTDGDVSDAATRT